MHILCTNYLCNVLQGKKLFDAAGSGNLTQVVAALNTGADIHWKDKVRTLLL